MNNQPYSSTGPSVRVSQQSNLYYFTVTDPSHREHPHFNASPANYLGGSSIGYEGSYIPPHPGRNREAEAGPNSGCPQVLSDHRSSGPTSGPVIRKIHPQAEYSNYSNYLRNSSSVRSSNTSGTLHSGIGTTAGERGWEQVTTLQREEVALNRLEETLAMALERLTLEEVQNLGLGIDCANFLRKPSNSIAKHQIIIISEILIRTLLLPVLGQGRSDHSISSMLSKKSIRNALRPRTGQYSR